MSKEYRVLVFGKTGCQKCTMLKRRLDRMFAKEEWQDFEKEYCDLGTSEGLVRFCKSECVNPSRIPALMITKRDPETGNYVPLENPSPGKPDAVCGKSKLYQRMGLQTDYSENGKGLITPTMITAVLEEARQVGA